MSELTFEQELELTRLDLRRTGETKLGLAARAAELERRLQSVSFMVAHTGSRSEDADKLAAQLLQVRAAIERSAGYEVEVKAKIGAIEGQISDPGRLKATAELREIEQRISDGQARAEEAMAALARAIEGLIVLCEAGDRVAHVHRLPGSTNRWRQPRLSLSLKGSATLGRRLNLTMSRTAESKHWAAGVLVEAEPVAVSS